MTQVACWADDLKSSGLDNMAQWHFVNLPYDPSGIPFQNPVQEENIMVVIDGLNEAAKRNSNNQQGWIVGFAVANLIHFYGDIHQPLHVTELFSSTYPNGDRGGNDISVTVDGTTTNLHDIWDSICWEYNAEITRPLNSQGQQTIQTLAQRLISTYTFTDAQMKEYNTTVMATEGYNDAISTAYPGITAGVTISQDYLSACIPVAEGRITLAGYRLGNQLEYLFKKWGHDEKLFAVHTLKHIAEGQAELRSRAEAQRAARKVL
eukprot:GDKJ01007731.1.p1 GENE.GDKJ01007731.1~~GDKJ01007731.1.p1  ORF type:complete len:302 (-),score=45.30 GDKJ01007731.1:180-968(-)